MLTCCLVNCSDFQPFQSGRPPSHCLVQPSTSLPSTWLCHSSLRPHPLPSPYLVYISAFLQLLKVPLCLLLTCGNCLSLRLRVSFINIRTRKCSRNIVHHLPLKTSVDNIGYHTFYQRYVFSFKPVVWTLPSRWPILCTIHEFYQETFPSNLRFPYTAPSHWGPRLEQTFVGIMCGGGKRRQQTWEFLSQHLHASQTAATPHFESPFSAGSSHTARENAVTQQLRHILFGALTLVSLLQHEPQTVWEIC